ncbi:MAG: hypothetical protein AVDCRST_MAG22-3113, partial [uncultured Rubrobacteraceae bacterium]
GEDDGDVGPGVGPGGGLGLDDGTGLLRTLHGPNGGHGV